jgi:hypothetical protein
VGPRRPRSATSPARSSTTRLQAALRRGRATSRRRPTARASATSARCTAPVAAGKVIAYQPDDAAKAIDIGTKIVDDAEWEKVEEGVYTGFSIGGST